MTFLEEIYPKVSAIKQISTDEFSVEFLDMGASYYRSMKSRQIDASTAVLMMLMERLGQKAEMMRSGRSQAFLLRVAERYEAAGVEVGREIARRSLLHSQHTPWVRQTLLRIVNDINAEHTAKWPDDNFSAPTIIIC